MVGSTAADGEHPEEGGSDSEGGSDPHGRQEFRVDGPGDAIHLSGALNGTDDDRSHGSSQGSGSTDCKGSEGGGDEGAARERARAVGEDAQEQRDSEGDIGDDEDNLGPLCDGAEGVHGRLDAVRDCNVLARGAGHGVQLGLEVGGGVGGPVELSLLACLVARSRDLAVAPKADEVGISQAQVGSRDVGPTGDSSDGGLGIGSRGDASSLGGVSSTRDEVRGVAGSAAGGSDDRIGEITLVEAPVA